MKSVHRALCFAVPAFISLPACATYSQLFINASGQMMQCSATGQGVIGMATASNAVNDCSANMRAAGYIEIEQAGVVGVVLSKSAPGDPVRILRVAERSPADSAGISAGDTITAVNGQPISSPDDARSLLFGLAGESVELAVVGSSGEQVYSLTRVPFTAAFGRPK